MASTDNPEWAALRLSLLPLAGTVACCGLNCTGPPTVDANHICVACKALCCGICRKRNADGTDLEHIRTYVFCTQHDEAAGGRGGDDLEDGEVGDLTNSAVGGLLGLRSAAAQSATSLTDAGGSSRPHVVTPPLDNDPATVWPEHSEEQRSQAVALIAGAEGNNYEANIRFLSRNVNLKKKDSMQKYNSLRPTNKRDCHKPPLHWVGVQSWEEAIINICIWQRVLTAAQREEEKKKAKKILPSIQHQLRKNVKALDKKRPPLQALESEQPSQPAAEGSRSSGRLRNAEIESLVARSAASAQDPGRQERARAAAGTVALEHPGLASSAAGRAELVGEREGRQKGAKRRRKLGQNAASGGEQADRQANAAVQTTYNKAAQAMDTVHYPRLGPGQPFRALMLVEYTEVQPSNPNGGRVTGAPAAEPRLTVVSSTADPKKMQGMVKMAARVVQGKPASSSREVQVDQITMEEGRSMAEQIKKRNEAMANTQPARKRASNTDIQRRNINRTVVRNPEEALRSPEKER